MDLQLISDAIGKILSNYGAELVTAIIGVLALWFRDRILNFLRIFWDSIVRIRRAQVAIASDAPWLVQAPRNRADLQESEIPILTFANLKGGVGKTTLAANIAAYFSTEVPSPRHPDRKCRVLLIDLDFQGSLSELLPVSWTPS